MTLSLSAVALAAVLSASPAPTATPTEAVKRGNDEVQKILKSKDATVEKLANKADEFVDFGELAKRALGKEWDKLTPKQRDEFSSTMKGLLRASYAQKALGQGEAKTTYGKETITGDEAEVESAIQVGADKFPVRYRLFRADAKAPWKIYDVITDEVSLMETYQDQFRRLIAQKGYDGLLKTLKDKREQLEKKSAELNEKSKPAAK